MIVRDPFNDLQISHALNGVLVGTSTVAVRGFDPPIVVPPGSGRVLNLYVRQDALLVPPRGIVQFRVGASEGDLGTAVFWGPAVVVPTAGSPGAGPFDTDRDAIERVTVLGGEQLLKDTVIGPRLMDSGWDVARIALELCGLYAHPALGVAVGNFPDTGAILSVYYAPEKTLYDALADLADTVPGGASFWVDAIGRVHFQAN